MAVGEAGKAWRLLMVLLGGVAAPFPYLQQADFYKTHLVFGLKQLYFASAVWFLELFTKVGLHAKLFV